MGELRGVPVARPAGGLGEGAAVALSAALAEAEAGALALGCGEGVPARGGEGVALAVLGGVAEVAGVSE